MILGDAGYQVERGTGRPTGGHTGRCQCHGLTLEESEQIRANKVAKRGGFEKKILLKEVIEN